MVQFRVNHRCSRLVMVPIVGGRSMRLLPRSRESQSSRLARQISTVTRRRSLRMQLLFDNSTASYQFGEVIAQVPSVNLSISLGVDGISLFFVRLTARRTPLCVLASEVNIGTMKKEYYGLFLLMEGLVLAVFVATDRLLFYICFEAVLIPMFVMIGVQGSHQSKVKAAYYFFRYTLVGSVLMLLGIVYRQVTVGTTDIVTRMHANLEASTQQQLQLAFFASFAVKVPMVPAHVQRPLAHVQAPTAGSVILAGILLKLGTYGMVRFLLGLFPRGTIYYTPRVYTLSILGIVYAARTAIRQTDMKRVIAYASVSHMNITLVGLFSLTTQGVEGALLQMLSHGLVAGALFMCVGVLYDRHHTRRIHYYGGVAQTMPMFVVIFLFFTMANIALPRTSSFVGEFLILMGIFQTNTFVAVMAATGMVTGGAYSLQLFNRVAYGNLKTQFVGVSTDLNRRERLSFIPRVVLTRRMGVYPVVFLDPMHVSVANRIEHVRRYS